MEFSAYALFPLLTAAAMLGLALHAGTRATAFSPELVVLLGACGLWSGAYGLEIAVPTFAHKLFLAKLSYLGIVTIPPAALVLALRTTDRGHWTAPRHVFALSLVPATLLMLVASNDFHGLFWPNAHIAHTGPVASLVLGRGPAYWANVTYAQLCLVTTAWLLVGKYRGRWPLYRSEAPIVLLSLCAPWLANATYLSGLEPIPGLDLTPMSFAVLGAALSFGLFREGGVWGVVRDIRRTIVHEMSDAVVAIDAHDRLVYLNIAACAILELPGYRHGEDAFQLLSAHPELIALFRSSSDLHSEIEFEDGRIYDALITRQTDAKNIQLTRLLVLRDITDQKHAERQIRQLAFRDSLTGLPNRESFRKALESALAEVDPSTSSTALLFADLDRFKQVNDTLGHGAGDQLLRAVADRLEASVRYSDRVARRVSVSRLGGDEFTVLLQGISAAMDAGRIAERLLEVIAQPIVIDGNEVSVSASIGIAISPRDGNDVETLLRNADAAMYEAKRRGRAEYQFYSAALNEAGARRLYLENRLRRAHERGDLSVHYQPIIDTASRQIRGAEALLRWLDAEEGSISPVEFVPIAEDTGLIGPIGAWVLRTACRECASWHRAGHRDLTISVNVCARQLQEPALLEILDAALADADLRPEALELEITESAAIDEYDPTIATLEEIRARGIRIALDDFGTGHSSLSYVRMLPLDRIKIDRSFVCELASDADARSLAETIVAMGKGLSLQVTAEGVETLDQLTHLEEQGCDSLQGFLFSPALAADDFAALLERGLDPKLWG